MASLLTILIERKVCEIQKKSLIFQRILESQTTKLQTLTCGVKEFGAFNPPNEHA